MPKARLAEQDGYFTRRDALKTAACGFGSLALNGLATAVSLPRGLHHTPRAKRVIFLFMHGGPSQVDTFDYKPMLQQMDGKKLPFAPAKNLDPSATAQAKLLGSPWKFQQHGEAGLWGSELFPEVSKRLDDLCRGLDEFDQHAFAAYGRFFAGFRMDKTDVITRCSLADTAGSETHATCFEPCNRSRQVVDP